MCEEPVSLPKGQRRVLQGPCQPPYFVGGAQPPSSLSATCQQETPHPSSKCGAGRCPREWSRTDLPVLPKKDLEIFRHGISGPNRHQAVGLPCTIDRMLQRRGCSHNDPMHMRRTSHLSTRH